MKQHTIQLSLTKEQFDIACKASEALTRSYLGQLDKAIDVVLDGVENISPENYSKLWDYANTMNATRLLTGFEYGASGYSIDSEAIGEEARTIGDIYQVMRFSDEQVRRFSETLELPSIEVNDNEQNSPYKLSLTEGHMDALARACCAYADIRLGNFGYLRELPIRKEGHEVSLLDKENAERLLNALGDSMLGSKRCTLVADKNCPEDAKIAFDMFCTMGNQFDKKNDFTDNNPQCSSHPKIEISKLENKDSRFAMRH